MDCGSKGVGRGWKIRTKGRQEAVEGRERGVKGEREEAGAKESEGDKEDGGS